VTKTWETTVPVKGNDEIFLSGLVLQQQVSGNTFATWSGNFSSNRPGISISWKWGAAVYTTFSNDYNMLNVKAAHQEALGNDNQPIKNSLHAGTPVAFALPRSCINGARGGGASNFTGSWSGTKSIKLGVVSNIQYSLEISATSGGTTDPAPGSYVYDAGSVVPVTAHPDSSFVLDHWELDGGSVGNSLTIDVPMDADHTLLAVFVTGD
jgi:hypothetical protein